jgi:hypothetical protein
MSSFNAGFQGRTCRFWCGTPAFNKLEKCKMPNIFKNFNVRFHVENGKLFYKPVEEN